MREELEQAAALLGEREQTARIQFISRALSLVGIGDAAVVEVKRLRDHWLLLRDARQATNEAMADAASD